MKSEQFGTLSEQARFKRDWKSKSVSKEILCKTCIHYSLMPVGTKLFGIPELQKPMDYCGLMGYATKINAVFKAHEYGAGDEVISWTPVTISLPDDEITVLVHHPDQDEPVWLGYYENDAWFTIDGNQLAPGAVRQWAHLPTGERE